eukprot:SAG31_NODE_2535_length_5550_cov_3.770134_4_plen_122_part_00
MRCVGRLGSTRPAPLALLLRRQPTPRLPTTMARTQQKVESGSGGSSSRRGGGCRFVSSAAAIAVAALLPTVAAPHGCGHPDCDGGHPLRVNPLRNVPPLPKVHYSWAIYPPFLDNLTVADG